MIQGCQRIFLWDNLKVVLMLMVVLTHCIVPYQSERWVGYYWIFIMTFTMPLFTIISGFWYKKRAFGKNVKQLLYPCILFSIINFTVGYKYYQTIYGEIKFLNLGYAMWYLWALFIYYCITPYLLKRVNVKVLIVLSIVLAMIVGVIPFVGGKLQLSRVICFYPFFLIGIFLREKFSDLCYSEKQHKVGWTVMILSVVIYIILQSYKPGIVFHTGFTTGYSLSLLGGLSRLFTYMICIAMSIAMIVIMPNKELWFSKYGTRTMNVYLLHMCIVFPLCWYISEPFRNDLSAYILSLLIVPLLCCLLFSKPVDSFMKKVLFKV